MAMIFATNVNPDSTANNRSLGTSSAKWDLYVDTINGTAYPGAPIVVTTSNSSASDALTVSTAATLASGQLVFVTLDKAMSGSENATIKFGSASAINLYLTNTKQLKAPYEAGTVLAFAYVNSKLVMINPPVAV